MKYPFVFVDESGISDGQDDRQPFFGIGFLKIYNTHDITDFLLQETFCNISLQKQKRRQIFADLKANNTNLSYDQFNQVLLSSSHNEYGFTEVNPLKVERYKTFIDIAMKFPFHFCTFLINKKSTDFNKDKHGSYWEAYNRSLRLLCEKNIKDDEKAILVADYLNRPKESTQTINDLITSTKKIANVIRTESFGSPLLQLCDVLLGSVIFQHKYSLGLVKESKRSVAKLELVKHISNHICGKEDGLYGNKTYYPKCNNGYFSIWNFKARDNEGYNGGCVET